jgi:hypothetical protein
MSPTTSVKQGQGLGRVNKTSGKRRRPSPSTYIVPVPGNVLISSVRSGVYAVVIAQKMKLLIRTPLMDGMVWYGVGMEMSVN